jgi:cytochrome P450
LFLTISWIYSRHARPALPASLPWIGKDPHKLFAETRAHLSSFGRVRQWLNEGYNTYSKRGQSYVFPDFTGVPQVIVPRSEMAWLLEQPDSVLSTSELHADILAGPYAFTHADILRDPYHERVIHRSLARRIGPLIMDVWDELGCAIDETWGTDTEQWKEVCVFDNMMHVIARASNRVFIGLPHCRNMEYLKAMGNFAQDVIQASTLLRFVPKMLEPLLGHVLALPNYYHGNQSIKIISPLVKERLANIQKKDEDPSFEWQEPNDYLSWHIRLARAEGKVSELTPEMIGRRLLPLNFAAIHTTTFTITNTFFDLLSTRAAVTPESPSKPVAPMEVIRNEARKEYIAGSQEWTKGNLARLISADSAVRESMRVSNFLTMGLTRKVVSKDGIRNPKSGWKVPSGTWIGMNVHSIMHDPEIYQNSESYNPFRFAQAREGDDDELLTRLNGGFSGETNGTAAPIQVKVDVPDKQDQKGNDRGLQGQRLNLSATSGTFLPFGHGRHAWYVFKCSVSSEFLLTACLVLVASLFRMN